MNKFFVAILLVFVGITPLRAQLATAENEVSIVALVITSGEETPVARRVAGTLERLGAQVLTTNAPNASQMRSLLKRFAAAAIDEDVALVYYDGPVLQLGERAFVAPREITLRRGSDLLTKAIPLSALARATALAGGGGAVLVHSSRMGVEMVDGVSLVETAPAPRPGTSPILFATAVASGDLADALESLATGRENISLTEALAALADIDGVSISQMPTGGAMLRQVPQPVAPSPETVQVSTTAAPVPVNPNPVAAPTTLPQITESSTRGSTGPAGGQQGREGQGSAAEPGSGDTGSGESGNAGQGNAETAISAAALAADSELSLDVLRAMQRALSRGQKRAIQQNLRALGFYRGLIDGIFGPQTAHAIADYQESIGASATGVLTPLQMEALSRDIARN